MSLEALQIQIEALDRASKPIQKIANEIEKLESSASAIDRVGKSVQGVGQNLTVGVTAPIAAGLGFAAKAAIDFEAGMAGAAKTIGTTGAETQALSNDIMRLSRVLPMSAAGLAEIAANGGQIGITAENIGEFVMLAGTMGTAFDMSADAAGDATAKLKNVYSLNLQGVNSMGDAINAVSNTSAASASQIVQAMTQAGGSFRQFGFSVNESVAISGSLSSFGRAPEVVATALSSMLPLLQTASNQMPKFQEGLARAGLSATGLEQAIAQDAMGGFQMLLDGLGQLDKQTRASVITDMFGAGSDSQILAQLVADSSGLTKNLELLGVASNYEGSMQDEFAVQAATRANQIQIFRNAVVEAGTALGNALLPAITSILTKVTPLIQKFAEFAQNNPQIAQMVLIFAGIAAAIGPVLIAIGMIAQGIGVVLGVLAKLKLIFLTVSAVASGPLLLGIAAIAALGIFIAANWERVAPAFQEVVASLRNLLAAFQPLGPMAAWVGRAFLKIGQVAVQVVGVAIRAFGRLLIFIVNLGLRAVAVVVNIAARITSILLSLAGKALQAGKNIVSSLAKGMMAGISAVISAGKSLAKAVMSVLPNSPVPTGPLTALNSISTNPGAKIVDMLSAGIRSQADALGNTLGGALSPATSPAALLAGNTTGQATPVSGVNTFTINLTVSEDMADQGIDALEQRLDELMARYGARQERLSFG